ncbi:hypothetical protein P7L53_08895 [Thermoleptolyngbya sichuanensis XZ-Cy5]|nr:hypothetical protein [Thermoleptolyngbya sichuanensis]MDG2616362.1 hypothetical protein [Thermoleptolyngbya sichuanensis XZ-Cy5]
MVTKKNQVTIYLSDEIRDKIKAIAPLVLPTRFTHSFYLLVLH